MSIVSPPIPNHVTIVVFFFLLITCVIFVSYKKYNIIDKHNFIFKHAYHSNFQHDLLDDDDSW